MSLRQLLAAFRAVGATPGTKEAIAYFSDSMYDWRQASTESLPLVLDLLESQSNSGEPVGIEINWPDAVGGNLVLHSGRESAVLLLSSGSRKVASGSQFVDLGWYIRSLVPALEPIGLFAIFARDEEQ
jgi:hypothetical protein